MQANKVSPSGHYESGTDSSIAVCYLQAILLKPYIWYEQLARPFPHSTDCLFRFIVSEVKKFYKNFRELLAGQL